MKNKEDKDRKQPQNTGQEPGALGQPQPIESAFIGAEEATPPGDQARADGGQNTPQEGSEKQPAAKREKAKQEELPTLWSPEELFYVPASSNVCHSRPKRGINPVVDALEWNVISRGANLCLGKEEVPVDRQLLNRLHLIEHALKDYAYIQSQKYGTQDTNTGLNKDGFFYGKKKRQITQEGTPFAGAYILVPMADLAKRVLGDRKHTSGELRDLEELLDMLQYGFTFNEEKDRPTIAYLHILGRRGAGRRSTPGKKQKGGSGRGNHKYLEVCITFPYAYNLHTAGKYYLHRYDFLASIPGNIRLNHRGAVVYLSEFIAKQKISYNDIKLSEEKLLAITGLKDTYDYKEGRRGNLRTILHSYLKALAEIGQIAYKPGNRKEPYIIRKLPAYTGEPIPRKPRKRKDTRPALTGEGTQQSINFPEGEPGKETPGSDGTPAQDSKGTK